MMNQLTIFDVINQFDEKRANWTNVLNEFDKCTVLAYIPEEALDPLECGLSYYSKERKRIYKLWGLYATAIWRELGFVDDAWEKATHKLKEYRNSKRPCPMEIHKDDLFKPDHVVKYL